MTDFDTPVGTLSGVGPRRAAALGKLGIFRAGDLLLYFPSAYQNRGNVRPIAEVADGEVCSLELTVATEPKLSLLPGPGRRTLLKFSAADGSGRIAVTFFNQDYLKRVLYKGMELRFYGRVTVRNGVREMSAPDFEPLHGARPLLPLLPVYRLTEGISRKLLTSFVEGLLALEIPYPAALPEEVRLRRGLCEPGYALRNIHLPESYEALAAARGYFIFEELFVFAAGMTAAKRSGVKSDSAAPRIRVSDADMERFYKALPFEPTGAQRRAVSEIAADMSRTDGPPMSRMVSGDVGSGKTVCAAAAVWTAAASGWQSAVMAPTEILARQHFDEFSRLLSPLGLTCGLLCGSTRAAERRSLLASLASGELDVLIGTHALLTPDVTFARLGLAVTDEQHRFGVRQRASLAREDGETGVRPNVLVMSATPIPRTLALVLYGDLALSVLDELPPGRQKIDTFIVGESYRERLNGFIRRQVSEGHQVYIVCPAVEASDEAADGDDGDLYLPDPRWERPDTPLKSAVEYAAALGAAFPELAVGCVHGRLKSSEKERIMRDFAEDRVHVLVSTTVVEVGVNVPNATLMVVENAERFGLSQLHQLRGRVGRGSAKSWCILVTDTKTETALRRLSVMRETNDGGKIAERDLELRGPGDFLPFALPGRPDTARESSRQHGEAAFRLASLGSDMEQLRTAFEDAESVLDADPALAAPKNAGLAAALRSMYGGGSLLN